MRSSTLFFSIFLMCSSCLRVQHTQPEVQIPTSWRISADEGSTLCNLKWWEQFNDPVLDNLIQIALRNNQDLKVAISRVHEYQARLGIANSALYPTVTGNYNFTRTKSSLAVPGMTSETTATTTTGTGSSTSTTTSTTSSAFSRTTSDNFGAFNVSWELDLWGRIRAQTDAAYAELLSQVDQRRALVLSTVTSVATSYITLRELDSKLTISKKTLQSRLSSLQLAKDRFELGETSEIEVKQAEAEVENAAIRVIEFEKSIVLQENQLSVLLGEVPQNIQRGLAVETFAYPVTIPAGLPSDLLTRRPDIMSAESTLMAQNARITAARALFFPQISLTGMYGTESEKLRKFLTATAQTWSYGAAVVQTIFDAGLTGYRVDVAIALREQAVAKYRQTILNAFREVDDALISTQKNQELLIEHEKQVKILNDYLNLAQLRYNEGEIDYLNVLDAERHLFDAELQLAQAQADNVLAVVQLYGALGGGWVQDADTVAVDSTTP